MSNREYPELQPQDRTGTREAVRNRIQEGVQNVRRREAREVEAYARELYQEARKILTEGVGDRPVEEVLEDLHWLIWNDPQRPLLDVSDEIEPQTVTQFKQITRMLERGRYVDPVRWLGVLADAAIALDFMSASSDLTRYPPVYLEPLEGQGVKTARDPTPVGRRRLAAGSTVELEEAEVTIPHSSCEHIAAVAKPRQGKDSTLVSIGMNLWKEHGYKYVSIYDDGRMETPMTAIPSDDPAIRQNLDRLGQDPEAFDTEVYVPAIEGLPDKMPANFKEFTISISDLTPFLILRLAGVNQARPTVEDRIQQALENTLQNTAEVPELVTRLQSLAQEQEATIEWTEIHDDHSGGGGDGEVETYQAHYEMDAEEALDEAAHRIAQLAGDGLLASDDAATNIDMKATIEDQEKAAILCCSFLPEGREGIKYIIVDLWLRLIHRVRDQYPRTPRVAVEIRELKSLAPSKYDNVRHVEQVRTLKQTLFFLSSQGGSRRILMLASSQKWTDIAKSVRSNFDTRIYLCLSEDEIDTLDRIHNFSPDMKRQLQEFKPGQGMIYAAGKPYWPIEFRGAPCGLGLGDVPWLDRYGRARGCRVRGTYHDWEAESSDEDWWVHVPEGADGVYDTDDPPRRGDLYSEWYLLERDFPEGAAPEDVDEDLIETVLEQRREHPLKSDLSLEPTDDEDKRRSVTMRAKADSREASIDQTLRQHQLPNSLRSFLVTDSGRLRTDDARQTMFRILEVIENHEITKYVDIEEATEGEITYSTAGNYLGDDDPLAVCVDKSGDEWTPTSVGEQALDVAWDVIADNLQGRES